MIGDDETLTVDDYVLTESATPEGFDRGLLTLTFDGAWASNAEHALATLDTFDFKSTLFVGTEVIDTIGADAVEVIRQFLADGHELGSHSVTHPDLTNITASQLETELTESRRYLESTFGIKIDLFASPFGAYDQAVLGAILNSFSVHRTTNVGYNTPSNWDASQIRVRNIRNSTTAAEVQVWVEEAQANQWWLVLVYHDGQADPGPFDATESAFVAQMAAIDRTGIPVVTMSEALAEIRPQLG